MTDLSWMTRAEREPVQKWAWRVFNSMTDQELADIATAIDPALLRGDDATSSARRRRHKLRPPMSLADDLAHRASVAKLDQPFGKRSK